MCVQVQLGYTVYATCNDEVIKLQIISTSFSQEK